jgi:hypothetical protein
MKSTFIFCFMATTNKSLQTGMWNLEKTAHKRIYKFCTKECLQVNNYKHGDGAKLYGYDGQI